jgi:hypothetical protein
MHSFPSERTTNNVNDCPKPAKMINIDEYTPVKHTRPALDPDDDNHFKRFIAKSAPIFWFQDQVEEVVMWRRGWGVTSIFAPFFVPFLWLFILLG